LPHERLCGCSGSSEASANARPERVARGDGAKAKERRELLGVILLRPRISSTTARGPCPAQLTKSGVGGM